MENLASSVAVLTAVVSLIATIAIHFNTVRNLKQKAVNTDVWLEKLENELLIIEKNMDNKIQNIAAQRNKDTIEFTQALAALNTLIVRLDATMNFVQMALTKIDMTLDKHDRKIDNINDK